MDDYAIVFDEVTKSFPRYHAFSAGIKHFALNLPKALKSIRESRFTALEGLSFKIRKGESVAFVGRNGSGKSTTLGLIASVLKPTSGKVHVNGRVLPMLELGSGFNTELTGRENIVLNSVLLGLSRKEAKSKVEKILDFAELVDFADEPLRVYSSGMLAKLGFSVIAHLNPEILVIDEVLAVGDQGFRRKCLEVMNDFKKKGVTLVFVSHNLEEIENTCEKVFWIDDHKIKMVGETSEVISSYLKTYESR